jgi:hypothetical protein
MQRKQSALLAKDHEDRTEQVPSHVESGSGVIGIYHNLASIGYQVTRDPVNA